MGNKEREGAFCPSCCKPVGRGRAEQLEQTLGSLPQTCLAPPRKGRDGVYTLTPLLLPNCCGRRPGYGLGICVRIGVSGAAKLLRREPLLSCQEVPVSRNAVKNVAKDV